MENRSRVFARHCGAAPPTAVGGDGCHLIDATGKRYFDGSGGAAVSCLGHSNQRVRDAIKHQLDALAYAHTGFFTSEPAEQLAEMLVAAAPRGIDRVYLVSGGSEAMEAALKLARQYHLERGEAARSRVIARRQSYHGNTLGALAVGGNAWRRRQFEPLLIDVSHIAPCYEYAERDQGETAAAYCERTALALEEEILRLGPETVMAFVAETVVGATMGAVPAVDGYFARIREICDRHGVLLILDEVMCGMGRTGRLFACDYDGVRPDIVCVAKGLGAGYQPIGAMLCSADIYAAIEAGSGSFQHGHTYLGHAAACAGAVAVLQELDDNDLVDRVRRLEPIFESALRRHLGDHRHVGDIRGRGFFWGVELVEDRASKRPFAPERRVAPTAKSAAFEAGLMCYPMQGTRDGRHGDHVLLAPPFIADAQDLEFVADRLASAIDVATRR